MSFVWGSLLIMLLWVPVLAFIYVRMQQRRRDLNTRYGDMSWVADARGGKVGSRRHWPPVFFLAGITVLLFSLARPQAIISLPRLEGTVILTFDVSGSMAAEDLKPTRIEAAKAAASQFVKNQPSSVLIGVVAFSDGGIAVQPPTDDRTETLDTIDRLVPRRGTSMGNGILVALNTIAVAEGDPAILKTSSSDTDPAEPVDQPQGWYPSSVIVLLTDGENNQNPDPMAAADLAADLGVRIYTVGVGSPEGIDLNVEGFVVHTQLDEQMLRGVSDITGGQYYSAANEEELFRIYDDLKPKLSARTEEMEITSILAGIGMLAFLVGGVISFLWFGRLP
jgi:Ca-activated chloride channel family protein